MFYIFSQMLSGLEHQLPSKVTYLTAHPVVSSLPYWSYIPIGQYTYLAFLRSSQRNCLLSNLFLKVFLNIRPTTGNKKESCVVGYVEKQNMKEYERRICCEHTENIVWESKLLVLQVFLFHSLHKVINFVTI